MDVSSESSPLRSTVVCLLWISEFTPLPGIYFQAERMVGLLANKAPFPELVFLSMCSDVCMKHNIMGFSLISIPHSSSEGV